MVLLLSPVILMEDAGGLHTVYRFCCVDRNDPPIHPPLTGEDPKGALYNQPGTAEPVIKCPPACGEVRAREGSYEVATQWARVLHPE